MQGLVKENNPIQRQGQNTLHGIYKNWIIINNLSFRWLLAHRSIQWANKPGQLQYIIILNPIKTIKIQGMLIFSQWKTRTVKIKAVGVCWESEIAMASIKWFENKIIKSDILISLWIRRLICISNKTAFNIGL